MTIIKLDPEEEFGDIETELAGKSTGELEAMLKSCKEISKTAQEAVLRHRYSLGIALSQGAYDKFKSAFPNIAVKYPAIVEQVPKYTVDADGKVTKSFVNRYTTQTPIGLGELPLAEINSTNELEHTELSAEDAAKLQELADAVEAANTVETLRTAILEYGLFKAELSKNYKVAEQLFVLRETLNMAKKTGAEAKLAKSLFSQRLMQAKIQGIQAVLANRAAGKYAAQARKRAEWMNSTGKALVEAELE